MWYAIIVPCVALVIILCLFRNKISWWEPLVLFVPSIIFIPICVLLTENIQTSDVEWLTQKCIHIEHHESWTREYQVWIPEQGHTDSKGNYHCDVAGHYETRTEYYPETWHKIGQNGSSYDISSQEYNRIKNIWQKEVYVKLYHAEQRHSWGDGRGDMFYVNWNGNHNDIKTITWTQNWTNRMKATNESVFRFPEIKPERAKELYNLPHPDSDYNCPCIFGYNDLEASKELLIQNALLGPRSENKYEKAVRMWILVFNSESDQDARDQEAYWKGGKKNEFTLCIGLKDNKPKWAYVISWTDNQRLKIDVRDYVMAQKEFNMLDIVKYMSKQCEDGFKRKRSEEWSYLSVKPPMWSIVLCWIVVICINVGMCFWIVNNDVDASSNTFSSNASSYGFSSKYTKSIYKSMPNIPFTKFKERSKWK